MAGHAGVRVRRCAGARHEAGHTVIALRVDGAEAQPGLAGGREGMEYRTNGSRTQVVVVV